MDKRNLNKLSNQITNNKIRHGSLTKKPSTDLYTVKRKKRSLNKKDTGRRISFLEQQGTIVEESTDSCIVNEKKDTNKLLTKKDNKMITDINNNITYDISNETNSSDKSSHSTVPHLYEKKDLNNLKPKLTNLTSITKRIKKNSLRSSVKFPKSKDLINERSKKNLNNTEKKIRKVRRGRISKKNSTLHSQSNITVESIKSRNHFKNKGETRDDEKKVSTERQKKGP
ncbi:Hypothetical protein SRAE_2000284500 [Strongyloides ratti]|uniref:Uncharacterized protein n=1 Tax=Strongyloides ratti TaxID=34506 RepID=A0A090LEN8_STRRB|nr:Hypothetical protein SRAE_2000284500 [Strongyloides ratti]CEF68187.1 Hypothetical protein SRAE_2000284500 [Strongyloides ratti]